jgi:hypothetical protein
MPPLPDDLPSAYELEAVPFYPQEDYQCGPATLAMALSFSGLALQPEDLVDEVYTPSRKGSLQMAMIGATRRHGRLAYEISGLESGGMEGLLTKFPGSNPFFKKSLPVTL